MIKCIVPLSGGKDSQVCLELAIAEFGVDSVLGLFCDTQFEHPLTYAHIEWMKGYYGVQVKTLCEGSVEQKVLRYKRFPSFQARFCTDELKTQPTKKFLKDWPGAVEVWYGMRTGESAQREKRYAGVDSELHAPHEIMPSKYPQYLAKKGVMFRLPIIDWTDEQVFNHLFPRMNPLYADFDRVGCFPCLAAGDEWKQHAFRHDEFGQEQKRKVIVLERQTGKSVWTSKTGDFNNRHGNLFEGCQICSI